MKTDLCFKPVMSIWETLRILKQLKRSPGGGTNVSLKVVEMLVVLLRCVNFGFWFHLGCSGENTIIIMYN